jgi:uncharacterized protein (TIGR03083 family)
MTATRVETIAPITRDEARVLATTEYARVAGQLRGLASDDWTTPTVCPGWDVRAMAGHTVGMMQDFTSLPRMVRRMGRAGVAAKRAGGPVVDSMTAQQVAELAGLSTDELIERAATLGPRAARWRTSTPAVLRRMPMKESVGGVAETWRMAYLFDVILTRDPWMHRSDIACATDRAMELTPDHDGRIVADVVGEWARRHARPFSMVLTGPAGGHYVAGDGGEHHELDAVEFCRTISGRATGAGLLTQEVPF